jgi:hypothetical protein
MGRHGLRNSTPDTQPNYTTKTMSFWQHKHPNIPSSFLKDLKEPESLHDAETQATIHAQVERDFSFHVELMNTELKMYETEEGTYIDGNREQVDELLQRKMKFLNSQRWHHSAHNAYWYWGQKQKEHLMSAGKS